MDYAIVAVTAFLASGLTLYSGFGLGTVLLPAFALFFPAPAAVAATATVHPLNNIFKGALVGRAAPRHTVLRFGLPAVPAAVLGAGALAWLGRPQSLFAWPASGPLIAPDGRRSGRGLNLPLFGCG